MNIPPIDLEERLRARFELLVEQHSTPVSPLASGLRALPGGANSFAATQGAWRFFANPKVSLQKLCQPLQHHVRQRLQELSCGYVLVVHDWSWINYKRHASKKDRMDHSHEYAKGYELLSALAVEVNLGAPLAPLNLELESSQGVLTGRHPDLQPLGTPHPQALLAQVSFVQALELPATCVHVVDREADTVLHLRALDQAGHRYVIRGYDNHNVICAGQSQPVKKLASQIEWTYSRPVLYHGQSAQQFVAEVPVVITRPYICTSQGKREYFPGPPVSLRLVLTQVRSGKGQVLAHWYLYTNLAQTVPAATIALWYYFRWRIECFHKLLKSSGWQMQDWQQESASAIAKRLAVVSMASALVWLIQFSSAPEAEGLRDELMRLSGRQTKRRQPVTAPALLAGLWTLLSAADLLQRYSPEQILSLAQQAQQATGRLGPPDV